MVRSSPNAGSDWCKDLRYNGITCYRGLSVSVSLCCFGTADLQTGYCPCDRTGVSCRRRMGYVMIERQ